MNWSLGLFRLWLVLTVMWVTGVGASTFLNRPQRGPWLDYQAVAKRPPPPPGQKPGLFDDIPRTTEIEATFAENMRAHIWWHGAMAAAVPLFSFVIGWVTLWIGRGFRTHQP
jgi:hypothetical protein